MNNKKITKSFPQNIKYVFMFEDKLFFNAKVDQKWLHDVYI